MRKIFLGFLFVVVFIFGMAEARAQCYCAGYKYEENNSRRSPYLTAYEELNNSEVVFIGEVVERKRVATPDEDDYEYVLTYKVKRAWKKEVEDVIEVREGGPCLLGLEKGDEVLVYAVFYENALRHRFCSRTRLSANAAADLKEFEEQGLKTQEIKKARIAKVY